MAYSHNTKYFKHWQYGFIAMIISYSPAYAQNWQQANQENEQIAMQQQIDQNQQDAANQMQEQRMEMEDQMRQQQQEQQSQMQIQQDTYNSQSLSQRMGGCC